MPHIPLKILIIEDNDDDTHLLLRHLSKSELDDHKAMTATSLKTANNLFRTEKFDLILLDLSLPDSYGLDTFTKVKSIVPSCSIIVLTGLDDKDLALQAIKNGAQDYLLKGELSSRLVERSISYAIERNKLRTNLEDALNRIKVLSGLLPICAHCKKIRDDKGYWSEVESYIGQHTDAKFTHGYCPECYEREMKILENLQINRDA